LGAAARPLAAFVGSGGAAGAACSRLDGEKTAALCREFDVSRKTGYKIFQRHKNCGLDGLTDRSWRPYRMANRLPFQIEKLIVQLQRERPSWGAPKIRKNLRPLHSDVQSPAISAST
jgi:putative transposase